MCAFYSRELAQNVYLDLENTGTRSTVTNTNPKTLQKTPFSLSVKNASPVSKVCL